MRLRQQLSARQIDMVLAGGRIPLTATEAGSAESPSG
jgi:hypothetical protein